MRGLLGILLTVMVLLFIYCLQYEKVRKITKYLAKGMVFFLILLLLVSGIMWGSSHHEETGRAYFGFSLGMLIVIGLGVWETKRTKNRQQNNQSNRHNQMNRNNQNPQDNQNRQNVQIDPRDHYGYTVDDLAVWEKQQKEKKTQNYPITEYDETINLYEIHTRLPEGYHFVEKLDEYGQAGIGVDYRFTQFSLIQNDRDEYFIRKFTVYNTENGVHCPIAIMEDGCKKINYTTECKETLIETVEAYYALHGEIKFMDAHKISWYDVRIADVIKEMLENQTIKFSTETCFGWSGV